MIDVITNYQDNNSIINLDSISMSLLGLYY